MREEEKDVYLREERATKKSTVRIKQETYFSVTVTTKVAVIGRKCLTE